MAIPKIIKETREKLEMNSEIGNIILSPSGTEEFEDVAIVQVKDMNNNQTLMGPGMVTCVTELLDNGPMVAFYT